MQNPNTANTSNLANDAATLHRQVFLTLNRIMSSEELTQLLSQLQCVARLLDILIHQLSQSIPPQFLPPPYSSRPLSSYISTPISSSRISTPDSLPPLASPTTSSDIEITHVVPGGPVSPSYPPPDQLDDEMDEDL